jgi:hypothetical protein
MSALLRLQAVERELATVRRRLQIRRSAVAVQQRKVDELKAAWQQLHEKTVHRRKDADLLGVDLRQKEDQVVRFRGALNTVKTNKEYAAILTQINSLKADNAKLEDEVLKVMQDADNVAAEARLKQQAIEAETQKLQEIQPTSQQEVQRLEGVFQELTAKRQEAAAAVPPRELGLFSRVAANYDGEAMAAIEIHGKKPPHEYVCGGCFLSLNAEHANALRVHDQVRTCDNCQRILYLEPQAESSNV